AGARRERADARSAAAPLRARIREIEASLEKLSREDGLIEKRLADPATYARFKPEDIAWANSRRAAIARETAALEEEWLEIAARLDAA
ncbi:ABC transporter ATP-binding protein, partial [Roseomonas alkaliterrae]|nr:ABC transporter ATP-binding protein [Neoroseomonas alkaliterrae]